MKTLQLFQIPARDVVLIAEALADGQMPSLQEVEFKQLRLGGVAMECINTAIEKRALFQLDELRLYGVHLESQDVEKLMKAVVRSHGLPSLKVLDMHEIKGLTAEGIMHIADAIEMGAFPNLKGLCVRLYRLDNEGLAALSRALKSNAVCSMNLTNLDLAL